MFNLIEKYTKLILQTRRRIGNEKKFNIVDGSMIIKPFYQKKTLFSFMYLPFKPLISAKTLDFFLLSLAAFYWKFISIMKFKRKKFITFYCLHNSGDVGGWNQRRMSEPKDWSDCWRKWNLRVTKLGFDLRKVGIWCGKL